MKILTKVQLFSLKKLAFSLIILLALTACSYAQKEDNSNPKNQPKVHINVNKQLDENGNVIRYDSAYSWSWSNFDSNVNDSIFAQFFPKSTFSWDSPFSVFDNDSSFFKSFSFPSFFDDPFLNFNINKEMEQFFNRHQQFIQEHKEMINMLFHSQKPIEQPNNTPQKNENKKTNNNDRQQQGVDM